MTYALVDCGASSAVLEGAPEARLYRGAVAEALGSRAGTVADLVHVAAPGIVQTAPPDDEKVLCSGGKHFVHPSDRWEIEERCEACASESWKTTTPLGKRAAKRKKSEVCHRGHSLTAEGSRLPNGRCKACAAQNSRAHRRAVKPGPRPARIPFEQAFAARDGKLVPLAPEGLLAFEGEVEEVTEDSILVRVVSDIGTDGPMRRMSWTAVLARSEATSVASDLDRVSGIASFVRSPSDVSRAFGSVESLEVVSSHAEEDARYGEGLGASFWDKVRREEGRAGCWVWKGSVDPRTGRGRGSALGSRRPAHLHAWSAIHGLLEDGQSLESDCGNPLCIRPSHQRIVRGPMLAGSAAAHASREECPKCGSELEITKSGRRCVPCTRARARANTAAYRARKTINHMEVRHEAQA